MALDSAITQLFPNTSLLKHGDLVDLSVSHRSPNPPHCEMLLCKESRKIMNFPKVDWPPLQSCVLCHHFL